MTKAFRLDIKSVSEDGTFEGVLSAYNVIDLGGDLIEPGAFTKTIHEHSGEFPLLWQHDTKEPIGKLYVTEVADALAVKGSFVLAVERAREAYELVKANVIRGLSIGYRVIAGKSRMEKGIRRISEIQLYEGSIVTFPMLPLAQISSVKEGERKADFLTELELAQTYAMRHMMMGALRDALDSIVWTMDYDAESKITLSRESIEQFGESYIQFLPTLLRAWGEMKAQPEAKAGRRISGATRKEIEGAIALLQALLAEEEGTEISAAPLPEEAAASITEPDQKKEFHSWLQTFEQALAGSVKAA